MRQRSRLRDRSSQLLRLALYGVAAAHVVEAIWLRRRRLALRELPETDGEDRVDLADELSAVAVDGVVVDPATRVAVALDMEGSGARLVDLVPGRLPTCRALRFLRRVSPNRLGEDPLYAPGGAHTAVVRHPSIAERMAQRPDGGRLPKEGGRPSDLAPHTMLAQRYAHGPEASAVRVAPNLQVGSWAPADRWRELDEVFVFPGGGLSEARVLLGLESAHLLALSVGLLGAPVAAGAALSAWSLQPLLVFAGRGRSGDDDRRQVGLRPPDLVGASVWRLPRAWAENIRATMAARQDEQAKRRTRSRGPEVPLPPTEELFDARREECPWCGSRAIVGLVDTEAMSQHKPGTFHLDKCTGCGHVFQNPALSLRGLDYYYDEAYDGEGEASTDVVFGGLGPVDRQRVKTVAQFTEPTAWLDVGTGYGHFCAAAQRELPDTVFDGLDIGQTVEEGARRGWLDRAYQGLFPELADGLPRSYDVVSMHHYLEHTRDPLRELEAAAKVLEPGGHLEIEVPDPADPWARWAGRFWLPWYQPQHQHLVPCENLIAALREAGFEVVSVQRGQAHMRSLDIASTAWMAANDLAGLPEVRWRPASDAAHPLRRVAVLGLATPVLLTAVIAEVVRDEWIRRGGNAKVGNTYRVVARRV